MAVSDAGYCLLKGGSVQCHGPSYHPAGFDLTEVVDAVAISHDKTQGCAQREKGAVVCWTANASPRPQKVRGRKNRDAAMAASEPPEAYSWLFYDSPTPAAFTDLGGSPTHVVGSRNGRPFDCTLAKGAVVCSGSSFSPTQLNSATGVIDLSIDPNAQVAVHDLSGALAISGRGAMLCGLFENEVRCTMGGIIQPFAGWPAARLEPAREWSFRSNATLTAMAAGDNHVCALATDGSVWCAGDNRWGQLGRPGPAQIERLEQVPGIEAASELQAGPRRTCVIVGEHDTLCWGYRGEGEPDD